MLMNECFRAHIPKILAKRVSKCAKMILNRLKLRKNAKSIRSITLPLHTKLRLAVFCCWSFPLPTFGACVCVEGVGGRENLCQGVIAWHTLTIIVTWDGWTFPIEPDEQLQSLKRIVQLGFTNICLLQGWCWAALVRSNLQQNMEPTVFGLPWAIIAGCTRHSW